MLRPGGAACPAPARTFTTELAWAGSPRNPTSVMTGWFIVIYHRRTFTGWTGSLMGCEPMHANTDSSRGFASIGGSKLDLFATCFWVQGLSSYPRRCHALGTEGNGTCFAGQWEIGY